jgi:ribosome-binding ATPase YchF (GTP1/OBG family)
MSKASVDPVADAETIETELMIADMERSKSGWPTCRASCAAATRTLWSKTRCCAARWRTGSGQPARTVQVSDDERKSKRGACCNC